MAFGYGLRIPHYGTIVVGDGNSIGNYAVIHTSTCITAGSKIIGDGLYVSAGAKVIKDIQLGDAVMVSANSVVNRSFPEGHVLVAGMPAEPKQEKAFWFEKDDVYSARVAQIEKLREALSLDN